MSLYYFDLPEGTGEPDLLGSEFPSLDAAQNQAVRYAGELLQQKRDAIWDGHDLRVQLCNADRTPVFTVVASAMSLFPAS